MINSFPLWLKINYIANGTVNYNRNDRENINKYMLSGYPISYNSLTIIESPKLVIFRLHIQKYVCTLYISKLIICRTLTTQIAIQITRGPGMRIVHPFIRSRDTFWRLSLRPYIFNYICTYLYSMDGGAISFVVFTKLEQCPPWAESINTRATQ